MSKIERDLDVQDLEDELGYVTNEKDYWGAIKSLIKIVTLLAKIVLEDKKHV